VQARRNEALPVRAYAEHHAGEVRRVAQALDWLRAESTISDNTMRRLGGLLNETHASLRDLYGISTPEVEALRELVLREPSVYGARLMGGGFGGNVLALVREDAVAALIENVQREFYAPRGRDALAEGAVMVSTPGAGLHTV
jgi:galactokinase